MQRIDLNTTQADRIGFTPERFGRLGFIIADGRNMILSAVTPRDGHDEYLRELIERIKSAGYTPARKNLQNGTIERI